MKILCIMLEFPRWELARAWSYTSSYAIVDGMESLGHEVLVLPALFAVEAGASHNWLTHAPALLEGEQFDMAWVWITHSAYSPEFWTWLKSVAPVRVGLVMESMSATPQEIAEMPHLAQRHAAVSQDLQHCTHALLCDEGDVAPVQAELGIPAAWYALAVPEKHIRTLDAPRQERASFIGTPYNETRRALLQHAEVQNLLAQPRMPEVDTPLPEAFDRLQAHTLVWLSAHAPSRSDLQQYDQALRTLRRNLYELTLDGIRLGAASVNLPAYFKSYPGRVIEAMAAGVPVVSNRVADDRPACARVFADGKDLLLYDADEPASLAQGIRKIIDDHELASQMVIRARNRLYALHTAEYRAAQIMRWLTSGAAVDYDHAPGPVPDADESRRYQQFLGAHPDWASQAPNADELSRWSRIEAYLAPIAEASPRRLKILDLGCGRGWLTELLSRHGEVLGCDLMPEAVAQARRNFPSLRFSVATVEHLLALEMHDAFDVIVASEVLADVPASDRPAFVRALWSLVRPGGHVIITTPRAEMRADWERAYGAPAQPVENWASEAEVQELFSGFAVCNLQRVFLLDIYQVWLFQKLSYLTAH